MENRQEASGQGLAKLSPDDFDIRLNLAEVLRQSDAAVDAVPHYRKAVELEPHDVDALYGLGDALRVSGEYGEAIGYLDHAHQLAPQDGEVLNALAIALEADRQLGRAMQCYHRAITLMPDALEPRCNYGQILFNEGFLRGCVKGVRRRLQSCRAPCQLAHPSRLGCRPVL